MRLFADVSRVLLFVAATALALVAAGRDAGVAAEQGPIFDPGGVACFETFETEARCDGSSAAGAASDLRMEFCLGWGEDCSESPLADVSMVDDSQYRVLVFFAPPDWTVAEPGDVRVGALAGRARGVFTFGYLNNPCSNTFNIPFTLMNAETDPADSVAPLGNGSFGPFTLDENPHNGIPDGADRYPTIVSDITEGAEPRLRLFGATRVGHFAVVNLLVLDPGAHFRLGAAEIDFDPGLGYPIVVLFQHPLPSSLPVSMSDHCAPELDEITLLGRTSDNPCSPASVPGAHCVGGGDMLLFVGAPVFPCEFVNQVDEDGDGALNDGCPQVNQFPETGSQCANTVSDDLEDGAVNDGCPVIGDVSEGARIPGDCTPEDEGGCTLLANPSTAGPHTFTLWAESWPDTDGDGTDNVLDVCALVPNSGWNPRLQDAVHDPDGDNLPNECDPAPAVRGPQSPLSVCPLGIVGPDEDEDCFANRQDNCPTTPQLDPKLPAPGYAMTDSDGDGVGDACDPAPLEQDGAVTSLCLKFELEVGAPAAPVSRIVDEFPGPGCANPKWGDVDCGGVVNAIDALRVLRHAAGLPNMLPPGCTFEGDVDCSGKTDAEDSLKLLRYSAALPNDVPTGCSAIGS